MDSVLNHFTPSIFTDLQFECLKLKKRKTLVRHRDIHLILADKALSGVDSQRVKEFLNPLSMSSESLDSRFDDETLSDFCSSRYLQQPSDVKKYCDNLEKFSGKLRSYASSLSNFNPQSQSHETESKKGSSSDSTSADSDKKDN